MAGIRRRLWPRRPDVGVRALGRRDADGHHTVRERSAGGRRLDALRSRLGAAASTMMAAQTISGGKYLDGGALLRPAFVLPSAVQSKATPSKVGGDKTWRHGKGRPCVALLLWAR